MKRAVILATLALTLLLGCGVPQEQYDTLAAELELLRADWSALVLEHESVKADLEEMKQENQYLSLQLAYVSDSLQENERERELLGHTVQNLETVVQDLEAVVTLRDLEVSSLQARIGDLQSQLNNYYVSGFYCTGSMRPYIDCGDEATWKRAFEESDITVGTVVSFRDPDGCGPDRDQTVAHRVIEVVVVSDVLHYRTQGDNTLSPDRCLIPITHINGVLAQLRKDVRPLPAGYEVYRAANDRYLEVGRAYYAAREQYDRRFLQYCGFPSNSGHTCTLPTFQYHDIIGLYNTLQTLRNQMNNAWDEYVHFRCVIDRICDT